MKWKKNTMTLALVAVLAGTGGCAYRHYLGMHGPSTRNYPEIHTEDIRDDIQCLECHSPKDNPGDAPATTHPGFKGCLKCHNDPLS